MPSARAIAPSALLSMCASACAAAAESPPDREVAVVASAPGASSPAVGAPSTSPPTTTRPPRSSFDTRLLFAPARADGARQVPVVAFEDHTDVRFWIGERGVPLEVPELVMAFTDGTSVLSAREGFDAITGADPKLLGDCLTWTLTAQPVSLGDAASRGVELRIGCHRTNESGDAIRSELLVAFRIASPPDHVDDFQRIYGGPGGEVTSLKSGCGVGTRVEVTIVGDALRVAHVHHLGGSGRGVACPFGSRETSVDLVPLPER